MLAAYGKASDIIWSHDNIINLAINILNIILNILKLILKLL